VVRDVEAVSASVSFSVSIRSDNGGVKLRKCFDGDRPAQERPPDPPAFMPVVPAQEAVVAVDGREAGTWYIPPRIGRRCWIDEDVEIPRRFTEGRDRIEISLRIAPGSEWRAAAYWIFSYRADREGSGEADA